MSSRTLFSYVILGWKFIMIFLSFLWNLFWDKLRLRKGCVFLSKKINSNSFFFLIWQKEENRRARKGDRSKKRKRNRICPSLEVKNLFMSSRTLFLYVILGCYLVHLFTFFFLPSKKYLFSDIIVLSFVVGTDFWVIFKCFFD